VARAPETVAALPDIPRADGNLGVDLAYPRPGARKPAADSTFVFGTVGTGEAELVVNGIRVPVAANGTFLAYLPVADAYRLQATARGRTAVDTFRYGQRLTPADARPLPRPRTATVISGRDTLDAASQIVAGRTAPGGDRRYFFPRGARVVVDATLPGAYRVRLTDSTTTWVDAATVELGAVGGPGAEDPERTGIGAVRTVSAPGYVDVRIPAGFAPFDVTAEPEAVGVTVFGRRASGPRIDAGGDAFVRGGRWTSAVADSSRLFLALGRSLWGYKAFYETDGTLVVRLRRPPRLSGTPSEGAGDSLRPPGRSLDGLRVLVDPGHPPGGAIGPTGLTEAEANLAIARRVAARLRDRGATVRMTRTSAAPLENATWTPDELWARVDLAVRSDAHLLVSIHNNAFPDGTNPFDNVGTETYYFHPFAEDLARMMAEEIAGVTGLRNQGAIRRSLALVRPTWMPAVLTESLYMMFPQQEAALRDDAFLDRLANAHVRAVERFVETRRR
jgi:N-acetylmuramoyl-L-alanine amidase